LAGRSPAKIIALAMEKKTGLKTWIAILLLAGTVADANAQLLTFDTLPPTVAGIVPGGYGGLNWINFDYLDYTADPSGNLGFSGYHAGAVSGHAVGFNAGGTPASFNSASVFTLTSLWLAGAWNDGLNVQIQGFNSGSLLFSNTFVVNTTAASFISLNYVNVDQVVFSSFGGTLNPTLVDRGEGTQFAMDNVQISPAIVAVPEPSTWGVASAVLVAGLMVARRRRR
jgi:hypothetical protein